METQKKQLNIISSTATKNSRTHAIFTFPQDWINTETLLYGNATLRFQENDEILKIVDEFIRQSNRTFSGKDYQYSQKFDVTFVLPHTYRQLFSSTFL